jgi:endonuclease/exonuclease/phosphatase (EEP) superfamily protein YafD
MSDAFAGRPAADDHGANAPIKIVSWNLLRRTGASLDDVARLIRRERPDIMLMQEATVELEPLASRVGGHFTRAPLPGRIHGPAVWSRRPWRSRPIVLALPSGAIVDRVCQIVDMGDFAIANVHLSHGQLLNRRQLRHIATHLPAHAAVLGDYNLVGPALLPGFLDVGPRRPTHVMGDIFPLRIDRCLVRGLVCRQSAVLPRETSDHHPIVVTLAIVPRAIAAQRARTRMFRDMAATGAWRRLVAGSEGSVAPGSRRSAWTVPWRR